MCVEAGHEPTNYGHVYNFGSFKNEGKTTNGGVFDNFGTFETTGTFINTGHLYNQCGGTTTGTITGRQPEENCSLGVQATATEPGYDAVGDVLHLDYAITNNYPYRLFDIKVGA